MSFQRLESDVRRAWAAVRFVDAGSARAIDGPLQLQADGARWQRNRSGLHVLMQLDRPAARRDEFAAHEAAFDPVPAVAPLALDCSVADPLGRYLPRRFALALPAPALQPLEVTLDPAPAAALLPTWAVLRVSVRHDGRPAPGVALRLQSPGGAQRYGRGSSDARGEALVVAAGIAQLGIGDGELVLQPEVAAELVLSFDPAAAEGAAPDPDALALRADVVRKTVNCQLASGRTQALNVDLP